MSVLSLTDPRVAAESAPFDRPMLYAESMRVPQTTGVGLAGSGGFVPKVLLKICVKDEEAEKAVAAIMESARTGEVGDGKIFVYPIGGVYRIRTGEKNEMAL